MCLTQLLVYAIIAPIRSSIKLTKSMTRPSPALDNTKELTRRAVFAQIRQQPEISRTEIATRTGLSKATVSAIIGELVLAGLVKESGSESSAIGRPRVLLQLVDDAKVALGVELTVEECRVVVVNLRAKPLDLIQRPVTDISLPGLMQILNECIHEVTAGIDATRIVGLGVSVPGLVHPPTGMVTHAVLLGWHDVPLGTELMRLFPWHVAIFSRGNAGLWGEYWYGAGKGGQNILYLRVGTGIGGGLVLNGRPYLGQDFAAGEFGHVTVVPDGITCLCGNRGCLATVASAPALLDRIRQLLAAPASGSNSLWALLDGDLRRLTLNVVLQAARQGNPVAIQALAEVGRWLGIALGSVINLLNLDKVIVGGPVADAQELLFEPLRAELAQRSETTHFKRAQVVAAELRENSAVIGAASLMLHELTDPLHRPITLLPAGERTSLFT
jgi:predicted NBD/HSP70 family sugar kinase